MRPPEFTGGNQVHDALREPRAGRFNEAAGIHRRKRDWRSCRYSGTTTGFNEAAGIHRRKRAELVISGVHDLLGFNEAAGIHRRKLCLLKGVAQKNDLLQ